MTRPIDRFVQENDVRILAVNIGARLTAAEEFPNGIHFHTVLSVGDKPFWSGEYSVGTGFVNEWVRKTQNAQKGWPPVRHNDLPPVGATSMTISQKEAMDLATERYKKAAPITAGEVLVSLASDAESSDQPFADWASEYGYSDDSIRAKQAWEACNDVRRALQSVFGSVDLDRLYAIARDEDPYAEDESRPGMG